MAEHLNSNMKRVELKRIVEFLWKGSPAEEKTPFASQGTLPDNGSFSKDLEAGDNKKAAKEFPEDEDKNVEGPMSISRKLCFAMSFNLWILYFLVLGWLLPCRHHECGLPYPEIMERSLPDIQPITDMEPMNVMGLPSLAMFGYSQGEELKLAALAIFDATFEWNISLPFAPGKIQCNFENSFDANEDGIDDCMLSGFKDEHLMVCAFNASNGYVFWHRHLPSEEGDILSGFHPTTVLGNETYLIGIYANKLVVLSAKTGKKILETNLPCSSPIDIRVMTNPVASNFTTWSLVCNDGDIIEAWSFDERDVLRGENFENYSTEFTRLYSGSNSGGSIYLRCDVKPVPGGPLLLSLADRVAMVTRETTAWEQYMPYPLTVAGIAVGNFTVISNEVAVAVLDGSDTIVYLMQLKDGIAFDSVTLSNRQAQWMVKVPGDKDLLLLKSAIVSNSTGRYDAFSEPMPYDQTNFVLIDFRSNPIKIKEIANETSVLRSSVNIQTNGEADLLVLKIENSTTTYVRYPFRASDAQKYFCHTDL